jgi:hypothetical protein
MNLFPFFLQKITKENGLAWRGCESNGGVICFADATIAYKCELCKTDNCNSGSRITAGSIVVVTLLRLLL